MFFSFSFPIFLKYFLMFQNDKGEMGTEINYWKMRMQKNLWSPDFVT